jgi:ribose transport system ATP-binding protein
MSGVVRPDSGNMEIEGVMSSFRNPAEATKAGIACIYQELSLVPDLTVADNISIINPPRRFGLIDRGEQRRIARKALARAGAPDIHPSTRVKDLPLSRRQMVEIAKALARDPQILILDEATSALTAGDVATVFTVLKQLRAEGLAIVYISHRMHEIAELANDCTVYRNGRYVATFESGTKSDEAIVEMMIGREYKSVFPPRPQKKTAHKTVLKVRNLSWAERLHGISFELKAGEIVGLGGLDGQGQRELLLALFGVLLGVGGTIEIDGKPASVKSPRAAKSLRAGMALIPEDRKTEGLMLPMSIRDNLSFVALDRITRFGIVDQARENELVGEMIRLLQIKAPDTGAPANALSGGNQQKVIIAKWLMNSPKIILLNDPTRGIDVGTKQELYQLMRRLADQGASLLFYSTDYDELIGLCDRVAVMYDGRFLRVLEGGEIDEKTLLASALNLEPGQARGVTAAVGE